MKNETPVTGKIVFAARIIAVTPVHIGSGLSEQSEMDVIRDHEGKPFIPASGFLGVLRHALSEVIEKQQISLSGFNRFWGYMEEDRGCQSSISCEDLLPLPGTSPVLAIRDGISINSGTGIVDETAKYDLEILEAGTVFTLRMEVTLHESSGEEANEECRLLRTIYELLRKEQVRIGAKTCNGLGEIRLVEDQSHLYLFDFKKKEDVLAWLKQDFSSRVPAAVEELGSAFEIGNRLCRIKAKMVLQSSLIVRSYNHEPEKPDAVQLESGENWVIPGSSLKGAIRARAERILNTLLDQKKNRNIVRELFGYVDEKQRKNNKKKGRLRVREVLFPKSDFTIELQSRIKVDRFTGGVVKGGLFDSMPIFAPKGDKTVDFFFEITEYEPEELGLLLLVLKDLWTGDLAIGGEKAIGRGVFQGKWAEITWEGESVILEEDLAALSMKDQGKLQGFVDALIGNEGE